MADFAKRSADCVIPYFLMTAMRLDSYSDSQILSSARLDFGSDLILPAQITAQIESRLLSQLLWFWADQPESGRVFSRETSFQLSTGQVCTPIAAWVDCDRAHQHSPEASADHWPICPNFVVELRSQGDRFHILNRRMETYLREVGMQLGWLIDCETQSLYVYRPDLPVLCLTNPELVSTAPILPKFVLDWRSLW